MVSLYTHRDSNIRKTFIIFAVFLIIVIGLGWFFSQIYGSPDILLIAVAFSTIMSIVSYWHSDKIVLAMANAVPVTRESNPELYRIVENLAITAGLPTPRIYWVNEPAPNAFATGRNPQNSVIAVTDGLLKKLDRSELEGVISHELSHIGNRDVLVGTVAVILVGFLSLLSDFILRLSLGRRRDVHPIVLLIGLALAILAPIAGTLLHLAVSRKREFLADASGALLTRYPEGLANALQKIASDETPMKVANNTTAHLWLDDPFKGKKKASWLHKLFMTHPPAEERIRALRSGGLS